jgi:hypothetical protein
MAQFCVDFSNQIFAMTAFARRFISMAITRRTFYRRPLAVADACCGGLSDALGRAGRIRRTNSIDVQNGNPKGFMHAGYGPWDDAEPDASVEVWQYASTAHVNAIGGGASNCDVDVAHGGIEYLKDLLIPALWMNNSVGIGRRWRVEQRTDAELQSPGLTRWHRSGRTRRRRGCGRTTR